MTVKEKKLRGKTSVEQNVGVQAAIRSEAKEVVVDHTSEATPVSEVAFIDVEGDLPTIPFDQEAAAVSAEPIQGELVDPKQQRLDEITHEIIECGQNIEANCAKIGALLHEAQVNKLWEGKFPNFEAYMNSMEVTRASGYRYINAHHVAMRLSLETPEIPLPNQSILNALYPVVNHPVFILFWRGCELLGNFRTVEWLTGMG